ncbi:T6SS effector BTH_I2691 family protein [Xanthomonas oryzae pv. oryzicola]|uniref:T6SS effector BTH_I2691 family protein n=1 Tax=Xanthomonas oryzae TaxID=347 RepID=UPI0031329AF6
MSGNDYTPSSLGTPGGPENVQVGVHTRDAKGAPVTELPSMTVRPEAGSDVPCDVCRSTGLAIVLVRHAVVPASCPGAGISPLEKGRGCSVNVSGADYDYALRTLRQGMVYVYYEQSGPYGPDFWECYAVAENGTLWRQASAEAARPIVGGGLPACKRESHQARRMEFIVIQRPELCGTVWIAFSQHCWTPDTLDRYASDASLRGERMQRIEPKKWVASPAASGDTAPVSGPQTLKSVMEYRSFALNMSEPSELPHHAKPRPISTRNGSNYGYSAAVLSSNATRYPWSLRNVQLKGDAAPDMALQEAYDHLRGSSHSGGSEQNSKPYTPMLLALWDAVGIVHELSGYRSDVLGHMARYNQERAIEFNALEHIEEIDVLLQHNAGVLSARYAQAGRDRLNEILEENAGSNHPGVEVLRSLDSDALWNGLPRAMLGAYQRDATKQWNEKYKPKIDWDRLNAFKAASQQFATAAVQLLEKRSLALKDWLNSPLLQVTLEDYDGTSLSCGIAFENVITDAVEGLAMDAQGRIVLGEFARNLDVTSRGCLLWRTVALNQTDARQELKDVLSEAETQLNAVLAGAGAAWTVFTQVASKLKKFLGYYKQMEKVAKEAVPTSAINRKFQESGVDRFMVSTGAFLLNRFPLKGVQDTIGNALARYVLKVRALMDPVEASNLIQLEASQAPEVRRYFAERVAYYRSQPRQQNSAMTLALADIETHKGRQMLVARWQNAAEKSSNAVRMAGLTGFLELINFINLMAKQDKQAKDYGSLIASGASLASTYVSVASVVGEDFYGDVSRTAVKAKAIGGWLGGFGTYVGVYYDFSSAYLNFKKENFALGLLSTIKAAGGLLTGGAQFITALAYSAPVLQKALGRGRVVTALEGMQAGIRAAVQETSKRAVGEALSQSERIFATQGMKRLGLWMLRLGAWEVTLVLTSIEVLVWALTPNALENWCEANCFGAVRTGGFLGFGDSEPQYGDLTKQENAFQQALGEIGVSVK